MSGGYNYPEGVTGAEPEIAGYDPEEDEVSDYCWDDNYADECEDVR